MTKAEIIARIDEKVGFSKKQATDVVEATFEIIKSCLEKGGNVKISGFGRVLTFKASPILKETINKTLSTAPQVPPTRVIPD